jgi:pimeloyl-ACP methyl ester carboxylesterase
VVEERVVDLAARRQAVVWDWSGPPGAPTLVLVHGATLDAELNWFPVAPALCQYFRVLTFDLRGHGRHGIPTKLPYRLEDCVDDVAAIVHALDVGPVIVVGYSMGGMIAQLFWRHHPELTAGLVLCATARNVKGSPMEQIVAMAMPMLVSAVSWMPPLVTVGADLLGGQLLDGNLTSRTRQGALTHMRRTPLATALSAMDAVCHFTSHSWIGDVDVPTGIMITGRDRVVPPGRQWKLARAMPDSVVVEIDGGHGIFLEQPGAFAMKLVEVCQAIASPDEYPNRQIRTIRTLTRGESEAQYG